MNSDWRLLGLPGGLLRRRGRVGGQEGGDLPTHPGAVSGIEVDDPVEVVVVGRQGEGGQEPLREVGARSGGQLHGQERHVGGRVPATESLVELDAVDHDRLGVLEVDVLEPEVAVPVADPPLLDPLLEPAGVPRQDLELPGPHGIERVLRDEPAHERLHLREVLDDIVANDLDGTRLRCRSPRSLEETREPPREPRQMIGRQRAPAKQCLGTVLVREPPHADGVVDDLPLGAEPVALRAEPDRDDTEIDVGREPSVQPHLVLAAAPASLERRVVHEPVVDGTLELPDFTVGEEHPGDMRRDLGDPRGSRGRIGLRAPEVIEERPGLCPPSPPRPAYAEPSATRRSTWEARLAGRRRGTRRSRMAWRGRCRPRFSGRGPCLRGIVGGDQDHGDGRNMATGVARHGQAVDPGEPEIGHYQIRPLAVDQRDCVRPGVGPKGLVARALEKPLAVRDEIRLVIDDQDGSSHSLPSVDDKSNRGARAGKTERSGRSPGR